MKVKQVLFFSFPTFLGILFITLCYILLTIVLINYRFIGGTIMSFAPIELKFHIFIELFLGLFSAFGIFNGILLFCNALLVGVNTDLLIKTVKLIQSNGALKFSFGGITILSLISTGCSACGISFLATLGLGSAFSFLPFFTTAVSVMTTLLLLFSAGYMVRKLLATNVCKL